MKNIYCIILEKELRIKHKNFSRFFALKPENKFDSQSAGKSATME